MAYQNDVILTHNGLKQLINLINTDPNSVKNIISGYANSRTIPTTGITEENADNYFDQDKKDSYKYPALEIINKDGSVKIALVGSDIEFYDEDGNQVPAQTGGNDFSDTPGTIQVAINGEKYDVPVIGLNGQNTISGNDKLIVGEEDDPCDLEVTGDLNVAGKINGAESAPSNTLTDSGYSFIPGQYLRDTNYEDGINVRLWNVLSSVTNTDNPPNANLKANRVYGAVFNDYAEYRSSDATEPGRCVIEQGNGTLVKATERLMAGANIVSDTFGFAIGQMENVNTPIAVCGRALAYPCEPKETYTAGDAVCSGPNGTVSKMSREEIKEWPDRIIGYVSEIPTYELWGSDDIKVNGRIWVKVV